MKTPLIVLMAGALAIVSLSSCGSAEDKRLTEQQRQVQKDADLAKETIDLKADQAKENLELQEKALKQEVDAEAKQAKQELEEEKRSN